MDRFLTDCSQFGSKKKALDNFQFEWNDDDDDLLCAGDNSILNRKESFDLSLTQTNCTFKETNPFLEDILQLFHRDKPVKEFRNVSNTLEAEAFTFNKSDGN